MAAPINKTTAETVVSARDGETAVFAGLITKDKAVARRSVPLLGDLPGIGGLFRYDTETEKRKELLIIMTPHIVRGKDDVDRIKELETERMSWLLSDLTEIHGDAGFDAGRGFWGEAGTVIYPDDDPSGALLDHAFPSTMLNPALGPNNGTQLRGRQIPQGNGTPRVMQGSPFIPQHIGAPHQQTLATPAQTLPVPQAPISNQNRYLPVSNVEQGQRIQYNLQLSNGRMVS